MVDDVFASTDAYPTGSEFHFGHLLKMWALHFAKSHHWYIGIPNCCNYVISHKEDASRGITHTDVHNENNNKKPAD